MINWRHVLWQTGLGLVVIFMTPLGFAQVMSSTNYRLDSDSVNFGGGYSSSTNYQTETTFGEIATGVSDSTNYSLRAGYQQMQEVYISLSVPTTLELLPALPGLTGGNSTGSVEAHVTTDSGGGYQLQIQAQNNPAMQMGVYSIADYTPAGLAPDFNFSVLANEASFGFSPTGSDVVTRYLADGGVCNEITGSSTGWRCWDGLSITAKALATGSGSNHPSGATTTIQFQVGIGNNAGVVPGEYVATTTITALSL